MVGQNGFIDMAKTILITGATGAVGSYTRGKSYTIRTSIYICCDSYIF